MCVLIGIAVQGLVWLLILGVVLFVAFAAIGFVKRKSLGHR
ncbi:hypothetical protein QRX50_29035 [Amycolatopsis carbonis]|uniref:Uncharacterized protein n=1 Tax=Amycolatopsis carbonis TaxID=715471 RepID=A0A9Y2I8J6_9PSEU|nr:hypothetical protein [Amycolatopsis sp. 2-15]WIX75547.1 hypothetical protein QRX50_29035 [Amycolatopsis sp. 2-15]